MPLPSESFDDYRSLLIPIDVPMLIGLQTQMRLGIATHKDVTSHYAEMKAIGIKIPLTLMIGKLYYKVVVDPAHHVNNAEYLFPITKPTQVRRSLGPTPAGSVYSALRRAYHIEARASDLNKYVKVTKERKGCQLFTKQPNRYRTILPERCVFSFDVALDVTFIGQVSVLNAVCKQTYFSGAALVSKQNSYTMWTTFMTVCVITYIGVPHNFMLIRLRHSFPLNFLRLVTFLVATLFLLLSALTGLSSTIDTMTHYVVL